MREQTQAWRGRWIAIAIAAISAVILIHHLGEVAAVLKEGVGKAGLTLDFRTYMCGAADLIRPYDICHNGEYVSGFVYPPPSLIYFNLLSRLPIDSAYLIHTALCLGVLAAASWMLLRWSQGGLMVKLGALSGALAIAPIGTSIAAGQVNILLMGSAVAGMYWASNKAPAKAGIAIALGFWLKIYPGLVPALFLTRGKWRSALAAILASAVIAILGLIWASPDLYVQYFLRLLPHAQSYTMPGVAQSLAGVTTHILAGGGQPILHFVPIPAMIQTASKLLLAGGILLAMAHGLVTKERAPADSLNLLLCMSLIAAPNAWGYHYALIFPVIFCALAQTFNRPTILRTPLVLACWLALVVPAWTNPPHVLSAQPWLNVPFRSRYAWVAIVLAALIVRDAWHTQRTRLTLTQPGLPEPSCAQGDDKAEIAESHSHK